MLLIAPLEIVYAWRTCRSRRSLWIAIGSGAAVAAIVALIAYAPVWIGMATLDGLREHGRPGLTAASTPSVVYWYLTHTYSARASARLLSVLIGGAFLGYTAFASLKIVDASSLLRACGRVAFAYVLLAPGYWPWYAAMPIALMALAPSEMFVWSILALSLASRLVAPIDLLQVNGAIDWETEIFVTTLIGIWAPAAFIGVLAACRARAVWPERYPALIAS